MKFPNFKEEKILWAQGFDVVAGLDEVGRGPLAGPVVSGAVFITPNKKILIKGINDSKKLSEKQRDYFFEFLTNNENIKWGIGIVPEKVIDEINILEATKLSMQKAIDALGCKVDYLLLDGNFSLDLSEAAFAKSYGVPKQKSIIKGDQKVFSISAASIIAKVTRDRIMAEYDKQYPEYGFKKHKGYGTKAHMDNLRRLGACPVHRKSFAPVAELSTG